MKLYTWSLLTLKRLLYKKGFLLMLTALPLLGVLLWYWSTHHTSGVEVGILRSEEALAQRTTERLLRNDTMFRFSIYDEEDTLMDAVRNRQLESAIIFSEDLTQKLMDGEMRGAIRLIKSPATVTQGMVAEIVFSEMLQEHAPDMIRDFVSDTAFLTDKTGTSDAIVSRFETYSAGGGTFHFNYEDVRSGAAPVSSTLQLFPIKGMLAIFVMLTAWINVLLWYRDRDRGIYGAFAARFRKEAGLISILIPVGLMVLAGFVLLLFTEGARSALKESALLLFYGLCVSLFLYGMKLFFRSAILYGALLPVALLGSLVVSPVLLDSSRYLPGVSVLQKLFFPTYYLAMSSGAFWSGFIGLVLMAVLGLIFIQFEDRRVFE